MKDNASSDEAIGAIGLVIIGAVGYALYYYSSTVHNAVDQLLATRITITTPADPQKLEIATQKAVENGFKKGLQSIGQKWNRAIEEDIRETKEDEKHFDETFQRAIKDLGKYGRDVKAACNRFSDPVENNLCETYGPEYGPEKVRKRREH
jgi:hypothetical protein